MHRAGWYLDFRILVPPLFEQEIVQIRQGQQEPIRDADTDNKALPNSIFLLYKICQNRTVLHHMRF